MPPIKHIFVLMLENRSFDHMLGATPFPGIDAITGKSTRINALPPGTGNSWNGKNFGASHDDGNELVRCRSRRCSSSFRSLSMAGCHIRTSRGTVNLPTVFAMRSRTLSIGSSNSGGGGRGSQQFLFAPARMPVAHARADEDLVVHTRRTLGERHLRCTLSSRLFRPMPKAGRGNFGISARMQVFLSATSEIPNRGARIFNGSDQTSS
jgi:hypothetical protein